MKELCWGWAGGLGPLKMIFQDGRSVEFSNNFQRPLEKASGKERGGESLVPCGSMGRSCSFDGYPLQSWLSLIGF